MLASGGSLAMSDVTHILSAIEGGDLQAAEKLLPLVYDELRRLGPSPDRPTTIGAMS